MELFFIFFYWLEWKLIKCDESLEMRLQHAKRSGGRGWCCCCYESDRLPPFLLTSRMSLTFSLACALPIFLSLGLIFAHSFHSPLPLFLQLTVLLPSCDLLARDPSLEYVDRSSTSLDFELTFIFKGIWFIRRSTINNHVVKPRAY